MSSMHAIVIQNYYLYYYYYYYYNHFMTLWTLSGTTQMSWYQKKQSPTQLSWSSIIPYLLPPSFMIHCILLL